MSSSVFHSHFSGSEFWSMGEVEPTRFRFRFRFPFGLIFPTKNATQNVIFIWTVSCFDCSQPERLCMYIHIYDYKTSATFIERKAEERRQKGNATLSWGISQLTLTQFFRGLGMFSGIAALCIDSSHGKLNVREGLALAAQNPSSIEDHLVLCICRIFFLATIRQRQN